jgi:hypothetical protein
MGQVALLDAEIFQGLQDLVAEVRSLIEIGQRRGDPAPAGCRSDIHALSACLTMDSWEKVVHAAGTMGVDLRDLTETEIAYLERVKVRTAQRWRSNGTGPKYRNEGSIRCPVRALWEWRRKGEQTSVDQRRTKGGRPV